MKIYSSANEAWEDTVLNLGRKGRDVSPRGMNIKEIQNYSLCITDPQKRIIHNPIRRMSLPYAFGEICWYLRGENSLRTMQYYSARMKNFSDDGETLNSAYGYRIFGHHPQIGFDQWKDVVERLRRDPDSRQAIIHLHTPNNKPTKDEVCTLSLQFMIRDGKLDMITNMRSNDIVWGFTYDVFSFTFMQELMANDLGINMGNYYHNVASMHLYEKDFNILKLLEDYEEEIVYARKYDTNRFDLQGLTLGLMKSLFLPTEERIRDGNLTEDMVAFSFDFDALNVMFDALLIYRKMRKDLHKDLKFDELDYSNLYHAMIANHLCKPNEYLSGRMPSFRIYDGADGVGKTTYANMRYEEKDYGMKNETILIHFKAPKDFNKYLYFYYSMMPVNIIFDRFWTSEVVYAPVYGRTCKVSRDDQKVLKMIMMKRNSKLVVFTFEESRYDEIERRIVARDGEYPEKDKMLKINKLYHELCEWNPTISTEKHIF